MRTARQALTDIAALQVHDPHVSRWIYADQVHAILADVETEPTAAWDRDAAREELARFFVGHDMLLEQTLDALEGCVRPAPAQGIDRDALVQTLFDAAYLSSMGAVADRILALLRPVEGGVTLTREEVVRARAWLDDLADHDCPSTTEDRALAARLEAAS